MSRYSRDYYHGFSERGRPQRRVLRELPRHQDKLPTSPQKHYVRNEVSRPENDIGVERNLGRTREIDDLTDRFNQIDVVINRSSDDNTDIICNSMLDKDERRLYKPPNDDLDGTAGSNMFNLSSLSNSSEDSLSRSRNEEISSNRELPSSHLHSTQSQYQTYSDTNVIEDTRHRARTDQTVSSRLYGELGEPTYTSSPTRVFQYGHGRIPVERSVYDSEYERHSHSPSRGVLPGFIPRTGNIYSHSQNGKAFFLSEEERIYQYNHDYSDLKNMDSDRPFATDQDERKEKDRYQSTEIQKEFPSRFQSNDCNFPEHDGTSVKSGVFLQRQRDEHEEQPNCGKGSRSLQNSHSDSRHYEETSRTDSRQHITRSQSDHSQYRSDSYPEQTYYKSDSQSESKWLTPDNIPDNYSDDWGYGAGIQLRRNLYNVRPRPSVLKEIKTEDYTTGGSSSVLGDVEKSKSFSASKSTAAGSEKSRQLHSLSLGPSCQSDTTDSSATKLQLPKAPNTVCSPNVSDAASCLKSSETINLAKTSDTVSSNIVSSTKDSGTVSSTEAVDIVTSDSSATKLQLPRTQEHLLGNTKDTVNSPKAPNTVFSPNVSDAASSLKSSETINLAKTSDTVSCTKALKSVSPAKTSNTVNSTKVSNIVDSRKASNIVSSTKDFGTVSSTKAVDIVNSAKTSDTIESTKASDIVTVSSTEACDVVTSTKNVCDTAYSTKGDSVSSTVKICVKPVTLVKLATEKNLTGKGSFIENNEDGDHNQKAKLATLSCQTPVKSMNPSSLIITPEKVQELRTSFLEKSPTLRTKQKHKSNSDNERNQLDDNCTSSDIQDKKSVDAEIPFNDSRTKNDDQLNGGLVIEEGSYDEDCEPMIVDVEPLSDHSVSPHCSEDGRNDFQEIDLIGIEDKPHDSQSKTDSIGDRNSQQCEGVDLVTVSNSSSRGSEHNLAGEDKASDKECGSVPVAAEPLSKNSGSQVSGQLGTDSIAVSDISQEGQAVSLNLDVKSVTIDSKLECEPHVKPVSGIPLLETTEGQLGPEDNVDLSTPSKISLTEPNKNSPKEPIRFKILDSRADNLQKLFKDSPLLNKRMNPNKSDRKSRQNDDMPVLVCVKDLMAKDKEQKETKIKTDREFKKIIDLYDSDEIDLGSDLGDSDDDDLLISTPSFLRSLEEQSRTQIPSTPEKSRHSLELEDSATHLEMPILEAQIPVTSKFSLDQMLAEKIEKADEVRKHQEMQAELKEDLRHGGFVKMTLEKPEEIQEDEMSLEQDQQQLLKNFQVSESAIMEVHPGDPVFHTQSYSQLFTECLTPQQCGFEPGESFVDSLLADIQPADYDIILTSDALFDCLEAVSCQSAVLRWLFFIMSIHSSHLIMEGCRQILCEAIHTQLQFHKLPKTWAPSVQDILTVFVNYGGDLHTFLPDSGLDASTLRATLSENNNHIAAPGNVTRFNRENLRQVITVVNFALQARPQYSNEELTTFFKIFSKAALDKSLNNHCLDYDFSVCLASILQLYRETDWSQQALQLCWILSSRTTNHHNLVYLLQLLMPNSRTSYIRQRTSFIILQKLLFDKEDVSEEELIGLKMNKLLKMVPMMRDYAHTDLYMLASMVNLLDMCVGNEVLKSTEKDDMLSLTDQLKRLTSEVRDNVRMLDRTRVKDMMVRVTSKWTLVMQATGSKQKSIFAYTHQQNTPLIETVQAHESDQSDQSDDEGSKNGQTTHKIHGTAHANHQNIAQLNTTDVVGGTVHADRQNKAAQSNTVDDLVKVGTDGVEDMDFTESGDYSDEDILPDI
ncbi:hypothetical protein ScPMuIL_001699 [Solemya velum]